MRNEGTTPIQLPTALALCLVCFLFAACAGSPETISTPTADPAAQSADSGAINTKATLIETDLQCHNERVTGSHMIQTVCTTAEQRREMAAAAKQWMRTGGRSGGVSKVRDPADPRDDDEDD